MRVRMRNMEHGEWKSENESENESESENEEEEQGARSMEHGLRDL